MMIAAAFVNPAITGCDRKLTTKPSRERPSASWMTPTMQRERDCERDEGLRPLRGERRSAAAVSSDTIATGPVASCPDEPQSAADEDREERGVEAVVGGQSGELRVGHRLRHEDDRDGDPGDEIGAQRGARNREPREKRQEPHEPVHGRRDSSSAALESTDPASGARGGLLPREAATSIGVPEGRTPMPQFAANTSFLFTEVDFLQRFGAARKAGFRGVEFHFPYEWQHEELERAARDAGVEVVLFNLPPGDWSKGERGIACHPDRVPEFRDGVAQALEYARVLRCPRVNCLAGIAPARRRPRPGAHDLRREPALRRRGRGRGRAHARDGADQHPLGPRLLPELDRAGARHHPRGRRRQPQDPVRRLPHADHGRRPGEDDPGRARRHRPHPVRRRARSARAGLGRGELPVAVRLDRPRRLSRVGGRGVHSGRRTDGWTVSAGSRPYL